MPYPASPSASPPPLYGATERIYLSPGSQPRLALLIHVAGVLTDADGDVVGTMRAEGGNGMSVFERDALHPATGTYELLLSAAETSVPGYYEVVWEYDLNDVAQAFVTLLEIGPPMPVYDALDEDGKDTVERVMVRFADLFDYAGTGPHLQSYWQTRFNRNRVAQLLQVALNRLNASAQPRTTYRLAEPGRFPYATWGGLLEQALYIEVVKHLRRSYLEQPVEQNITLARLDRRDYFDRWGQILAEEEPLFREQLEVFKIEHMGLGNFGILVGGGVFGGLSRYARTPPSFVATRPIHWGAFY